MNNKVDDIFEKLIKPIPIEVKLRGLNTSVFGGFDSYILEWTNKLMIKTDSNEIKEIAQSLKFLFNDYKKVTIDDRQQKLRDSIKLVNQLSERIKGVKAFKLKQNKLVKIRAEDSNLTYNNPIDQQQRNQQQDLTVSDNTEVKKVETDSSDLWHQTIQYIKGVGEYWAKRLKKLGIESIKDLLYYFPRDYNDWSNCQQISRLSSGMKVTVQGRVVDINQIQPRKGLTIIKIGISDGTGVLYGVWFNQKYIKKGFTKGDYYLFSGEVKYSYGQFEINNPHYEELDSTEPLHTGKIVPVYPATKGVSQKRLRTVINNCLDKYLTDVPEFLPEEILNKYDLLAIKEALQLIHFPDSKEKLKQARKRLAYEELFVLQLGLALRKKEAKTDKLGIQHLADNELIEKFFDLLPFELTSAQQRAWTEIEADMEAKEQMNRLLQGDVGAGKTVIATLALLKTVQSGFQGGLMAPTEILAEQHYLGLKEELNPLGIKLGLLVGSLTNKEKEKLLARIKEGEIDIIIGTHALIQEGVNFSQLGLAIIDEQHRFGVKQRALLQEKGTNPDILVMTATPIPRTLALTVYGDLDLSVIDELPPGRKPVITEWRTAKARQRIYSFIRQEIEQGRQAYIVCPLVEESEKLDIRSATELAEYLEEEVFPDLEIGLLHGQIKSKAKEEIMEEFRLGEVDILVATTVIEVGVNVPNASIMVIEDAQRFGLAQLHQLRGRVGRGQYQSYCILIANPSTDEGQERMKIMTKSNDGFVIAEEDLQLRGPGEFFGTRQHGMPDLKVADILRDHKLLELAREDAFALVEQDQNLVQKKHQLLKQVLTEVFEYDFDLIDIS
ncbi:ATP-dependent DNA helicase RecG [Natroniella sulfidigena]|uniref:ATP-dependent DNA helicase RecG n=1 Tax=Natroniella sulfidigena TaxID=723921 RepID=UPI00200A9FB8|nr:ATP-dependent DNA helicase RecG [Natroniella sulfidigena]MCK8818148.1 ATP-dependent DNA helicase RecG [Natroniella sulfidigena]